MLTLRVVEDILGTHLPVPSRVPPTWGTVWSSEWQVDALTAAARLEIAMDGKGSTRPGLVIIDYDTQAAVRPTAAELDPWHLVFDASTDELSVLCSLDRRCPLDEARSFVYGFRTERCDLLSYETLEEARARTPRGTAASSGRWRNHAPQRWFDQEGGTVSDLALDADFDEHPRPTFDELAANLGLAVPTLTEWPPEFGMLAETRYQQRTRESPIGGSPVRSVVLRWRFQPHRESSDNEVVVAVRLDLDDTQKGSHTIGPWIVGNTRSRPQLAPELWQAVWRGLRSSL